MGWKESMHVQTIAHPLLALGHLCEGGVMRQSMKKRGGGSFVRTPLLGIKTRPTKRGGRVCKNPHGVVSAEVPPPLLYSTHHAHRDRSSIAHVQ